MSFVKRLGSTLVSKGAVARHGEQGAVANVRVHATWTGQGMTSSSGISKMPSRQFGCLSSFNLAEGLPVAIIDRIIIIRNLHGCPEVRTEGNPATLGSGLLGMTMTETVDGQKC
ncbi:hypothetical protein, partial [Paraburkholderia solitsugae]|uniref:hypothetical protein n=1 Tax=Paraburkholderia solitsugae TaxID=2675748 RepID=UPI001C12DDE9